MTSPSVQSVGVKSQGGRCQLPLNIWFKHVKFQVTILKKTCQTDAHYHKSPQMKLVHWRYGSLLQVIVEVALETSCNFFFGTRGAIAECNQSWHGVFGGAGLWVFM